MRKSFLLSIQFSILIIGYLEFIKDQSLSGSTAPWPIELLPELSLLPNNENPPNTDLLIYDNFEEAFEACSFKYCL